MGAGRTSPTTAPAEPSRLPSMEGAPSTGERAVLLPLGQLVAAGRAVHGGAGARRSLRARRRASQGRAAHGGAGRPAPAEPGQDLLGRYGGRGPENPAPRPLARPLASPSARTPAAHPGGSRRCRPTRPWRAPAARHTPGRVELTMSPQLTLCELSSHELSSGGFCQAELASCEPGWILLSRPGRLFWDRPSGAGGTPGTTRGGGVSKSATKAPRAGIGREEKRGISTILFRCFGSIRAFVADLDNWRRRGPRGEGVARLGEVHDVNTGADTRAEGGRGPGEHPVRPRRPRPSTAAGPAQAPQSARSPLNPRERTSSRRSRGLPGDLGG